MLELNAKEMIKLIEKKAEEVIAEKGYDFDLADVEFEGSFFKVENRANHDPANDYVELADTLYIDEEHLKEALAKGFAEYYDR